MKLLSWQALGAVRGLAGPDEDLDSSQALKDVVFSKGLFPQSLTLFYWENTFCSSWPRGVPDFRICLFSNFLGDVLGNIWMTSRWVIYSYWEMHSLFEFSTSLDFILS